VFKATDSGIGLWEDTFDYFTAAQSLVAGDGIGRWTGGGEFRPMTHFPPGYPIVLAALDVAGLGLQAGARLLNGALFGSTAVLAAGVVWQATRSSAGSLLAAGLTLASEPLIRVETWALSEGLYLFLMAASLYLLVLYVRRPSETLLLIGSGVISGTAFLTRYAGLSLLVSGALGLLILLRLGLVERLKSASVYILISALPTAMFMVRNMSLTGNPADRPSLVWHPPSEAAWELGARTIIDWWIPDRIALALEGASLVVAFAVFATLLLGAVVWQVRILRRFDGERAHRPTDSDLLLLMGLGCYAAFLLTSVLFVDQLTPLDNRILSPFYLLSMLLVVAAIARGLRSRTALFRAVSLTLGILLLCFNVYRGQGLVRGLARNGQGFASRAWQESETIEFIRELPDIPLYSNEIQAIYFLSGRIASFIPVPQEPSTGGERADYIDRLDRMRQRVHAEGAILVLFGGNPPRVDPDTLRDLTSGLTLLRVFEDGVVYGESLPGS
jgi:hypothetical protein